jgi:HEPN domain-containing protein
MNRVFKNWEGTSNYDLRTAEAMYKAGRYLYVVFMCCLAIEKMLKAILSKRILKKRLPRFTT